MTAGISPPPPPDFGWRPNRLFAAGVVAVMIVAAALIAVALTRPDHRRSSAAVRSSPSIGASSSGATGSAGSSGSAGASGTAGSSTSTGNEAPTRTNTGDPSASPTPAPDPQAPAAERAATTFAVAYTERRHTDVQPGSWVGRAAASATATFAATLHTRYDGTVADAAWTALVSSHTDVGTTVVSAVVDTGFHADADLRLVRVAYTSVHRQGSVALPGTGHRGTLSLFLTDASGSWLVDGIASAG